MDVRSLEQNTNNILKLRDSAFDFTNKVDDEKFHNDILELIFGTKINTPCERVIMKGIQSIIPKKWDDIKDAVKGLIKIYDDAVEDDSVGDDSDDDSSSSESESDDSSSSESESESDDSGESESSSESESELDAPKMTTIVLPKHKHRVFEPIAGIPVGLRDAARMAVKSLEEIKQEKDNTVSEVFERPDPKEFLANLDNYTIKYIHNILKKYPEDYDNEYAKFVLGLYIPCANPSVLDGMDISKVIFGMLFGLTRDVVQRQATIVAEWSINEDSDIAEIASRHLKLYGTDKYDRRELLKDMYTYLADIPYEYEPVLYNYIMKEVDYDYLVNNGVKLKGDTAIVYSLLTKGAKK